eukprot:CAMPEP_0119017592 /NCGR_PEP_ID=MMETSP1176-20130426/17052_1 /TAXON_ID=265551 /ORGANISM="Synedropsis recta cf, Strain CCMP1620" /LENGTH=65 /DNA_ID=CAMNT_0006971355 /DNA_START=1 /DNA_END=195 /DNA_ORIENTATION=-
MKAESSSSGISSYNPISNLEQQYAAPIGQRRHLFVKLNPNCCLIGGVESLLKLNGSGVGSGVGGV